MEHGAEQRLVEILDLDAAHGDEFAASYKLRADPRVTEIGHHLRRTSLDELPQLWNVLKGDMSLVGLRPIVPDEVERYEPHLEQVLQVKHGITGAWQVTGRSDTSYARRVELDVRYARTRSVGRDVLICLKTAFMMVRPRNAGAY